MYIENQKKKMAASTGSSFLNDAFKLAPPFIFFHYTLAAELCKEKMNFAFAGELFQRHGQTVPGR